MGDRNKTGGTEATGSVELRPARRSVQVDRESFRPEKA